MSERTTWLAALFIALLFGVGGPVSCSMHQNAAVERMVKSGADPIRAACAVKSDMMAANICAMEMQR